MTTGKLVGHAYTCGRSQCIAQNYRDRVASLPPAAGLCRYCGKPRPVGCTVTCGGSECQEADYREHATPRKRKAKKPQPTDGAK